MKQILAVVIICFGLNAQSYVDDLSVIRAILDSNGITGIAIDGLTKSESDRVVALDLSSEALSGNYLSRINPEIARLDALETLSLASHGLFAVPDEIGALVHLEKLDISGNEIDRFPASMQALTKLEILDAHNNDLKELPTWIGNLSALRVLHLRGNDLSTLPSEIGQLANLRELYILGNRLETLPGALQSMNLTYVEIGENRLCSVPVAMDQWLKKIDKNYRSWQRCN